MPLFTSLLTFHPTDFTHLAKGGAVPPEDLLNEAIGLEQDGNTTQAEAIFATAVEVAEYLTA